MRSLSKNWNVSELTIRVDRLRLRLRGVSAEDARLAAAVLGRTVAEGLAAEAPAGASGRAAIASVNLGAVPLAMAARPEAVRAAIAHSISKALGERLPSEGGQL